MLALSERLGHALQDAGRTLCVAESCTGGGLAEAITAIAGSSAWFECGWVTYTNAAKMRLLGVPSAVFAEHGAVSGPCVAAMSAGALERAEADYAVAISGIAGPGGGSTEKPVGTVWIAWRFRGQAAVASSASRVGEAGTDRRPGPSFMSVKFHFSGDRLAVRDQAVVMAMQGVLNHLETGGWFDGAAAD
ncbi:hypothetical protein A9404_11305 [Halothiobacillus diazotrophicus]|uniref:CinA C-terminal domain-containing protein n=2 Tax=Halothiobacillus diazotrophicus TaxID=1860122 RepID=A0A191ZJ37_9GAMM|nr:hypothetical protein A9404_11305 [Halothiobacillus diazotrophicus]